MRDASGLRSDRASRLNFTGGPIAILVFYISMFQFHRGDQGSDSFNTSTASTVQTVRTTGVVHAEAEVIEQDNCTLINIPCEGLVNSDNSNIQVTS